MQTDIIALEKRMQLAGQLVTEDEYVQQMFATKQGIIWAHLYLYAALHCTLAGHKGTALRYVWKAIRNQWQSLLTKKAVVIFVKLF